MNLQTVNDSCLYVDLPGYKSPSIITGDTYRSDLLLSTSSKCLYIIELTVGFESNLQNNVERKKSKYKELISEQQEHFDSVKPVADEQVFYDKFLCDKFYLPSARVYMQHILYDKFSYDKFYFTGVNVSTSLL